MTEDAVLTFVCFCHKGTAHVIKLDYFVGL